MKILSWFLLIGATMTLSSCASPADVASQNLSTAADQFQINRRIVFYNGFTGTYMLDIEGYCSLGNDDKPRELSVTCKTGPNEYKKDFLGLSDNVTYFVEQLDPANASPYNYKILFRPETIIPSLEAN